MTRRHSIAILAILLGLTMLAFGPGAAAADPQPTLSVDPATVTVIPGQAFVINIVQNAAVATTGAQVSVTFDPSLTQLKDFELGPAYTSASAVFVFGNADLGSNANKDLAMARANKVGVLENVAGFLLPGSGTIPAGETVFIKLSFVARSAPPGQRIMGLGHASMLGESGNGLDPILKPGTLVLGAGGAPGASGSLAGGLPSPSPTVAASEAPLALANPTSPVKVSIAPTSITLQAGMPARVFLIADADGNTSSVAADVTFDRTKLEITGLEVGPAWSGAVPIAVSGGSTRGLDGAIADANTTGVLQQAGAFFTPGAQDMPSGEGVFVSVLVKGKVGGTSSLSIGNVAVLGVSGENIPVAVDPASLTKAPDKPIQLDPVLIGLLVILLALVVASIAIVRSGRIPVRVRRRWPYYVSLALGLIPVVLFGMIVLMLLVNSAPVVSTPGIPAILGSEYSSKYSAAPNSGLYGLLPALWGTVLIALVAVTVALPISLALAIVAVDFPIGPITRVVRPVVGILSGIPPIVYAISVPVFITVLMIPKFAANANFSTFDPATIGADPSTWPPSDVPYSAGGFPWDLTGVANSTLLGGLLIALFLIPFVTPLFVDALRDVPRAAREASLALGANRTYTIRRVVLPRALPALMGAAMLAVLKALGDTLIVAFAVGWSADTIPQPLFDVLERTSSLAAQGAGQILSVETLGASCTPAECAVGYTSALMLLSFAGVVVVAITYLQARGRRRVAT